MDIWKNLKGLFIELARDATAQYAPFPVNTLLRSMLEMGRTQTSALERIESKLDRVATKSFHEGLAFLEEAYRCSSHEDDRNRDILLARNKFIEARVKHDYPGIQTLATFFLAISYGLLSNKTQAFQCLEEAHHLASRLVVQQFERHRSRHRAGLKCPESNDKIPWAVVFSPEDSPLLQMPRRIDGIEKQIKEKEAEIRSEESKARQQVASAPRQAQQLSKNLFKQKSAYEVRGPSRLGVASSSSIFSAPTPRLPIKAASPYDQTKFRPQTTSIPRYQFLEGLDLGSIRSGNRYLTDPKLDSQEHHIRALRLKLTTLQSQLHEVESQYRQLSNALEDARKCLNPELEQVFDIALHTTSLLATLKRS